MWNHYGSMYWEDCEKQGNKHPTNKQTNNPTNKQKNKRTNKQTNKQPPKNTHTPHTHTPIGHSHTAAHCIPIEVGTAPVTKNQYIWWFFSKLKTLFFCKMIQLQLA